MKIICIYTKCICDCQGGKECEYGYEDLGYDKECKYYHCPSDHLTRNDKGHLIIHDTCTHRDYVRQAFENEYKKFEFSDNTGLQVGKRYIPVDNIRYLKIGDTIMIKR